MMDSIRMKDLYKVAPNYSDMMPTIKSRDVHNHAPELGAAPKKCPSTAITRPGQLDVDQMIL